MRIISLNVQPFAFNRIIDCEMLKSVNEHGFARLKGYIDEEFEEEYLKLATEDISIEISGKDELGSEEILFCGVLDDLRIQTVGGLKEMELLIAPHTRLMDITPETFTFQNANMRYEQLLQKVLGNRIYQNAGVIMRTGSESPLGDLIVQYKETDWEFVIRLASHFETIVVPNYTKHGVKFYFGVPEGTRAAQLQPISYRVKKKVNEYIYKTQNMEQPLPETAALCYEITEREVRRIGEVINFHGKKMLISRIVSKWEGEELIHQYDLSTPEGFRVPKKYNERVVGAALNGNILAVSGDMVKVHVAVDPAQEQENARWFPYATVYSSPDGSGWYCMPEPGDEIRLYFPNEKEAQAYVQSSVHLNTAALAQGRRSNPDNKSIITKYGKRVELTPTEAFISNGDGMEIRLIDGEEISIKSNKNITINADGAIGIVSEKDMIELIGEQGVTIRSNTGQVALTDAVVFKGADINVE